MKKIVLSLSISLILIIAFHTGWSQIISGTVYQTEKDSQTSLTEIVKYDKMFPADTNPKMKTPKPDWVYPEFEVDESKIIDRYTEKWETSPSYAPMDDSPLPDASFQGLGDNNNSIPPDVNSAVGPNHLMITLNPQVRIQNKSGGNISTVSLSSFWNGMPGASATFDPKILYDPYEERWIFIAVSGSSSSSSRVMVAVSQTDDPTGIWNRYTIDSDPNNTGWLDYPSIGFNKKWVVVTGNMFSNGGSYQNNAFFIISKQDLYDGIPNAQYTRIAYNPSYTIVPAVTYDEELEDIYLISNYSAGYISKYKISGEIGSETFELEGFINNSNGWATYSGGNGDFSPQLGSTTKINAGDSRMQKVIYRNGKIWAVHHVFVPQSNPNRSVVQWWELDEDGTVLQFGRVDEPNMHFTYATIAVNALEEIMIGYSSFSSTQYASASYSFRSADDPQNTLRDRYQFKDGLAKYVKTYGGSRNRWGDYSATQVDPVNDLNFWTLQEYAETPSGSDRWGTWWAMIIREAAPLPEFTSNATIVPVSESVNFTDESLYQPNSWNWTFEGGSPSSSNEQNPQNITYNSSGTFDVTLTVTNDAGSNTITKTAYITASTTILPEVNFVAADTVPCIGEQVFFSDETLYNPNTWNWSITPSSYEFVDGTNASSQHPVIEFLEPGQFTISLSTTNVNGSNSLVLTDYISAGGYQMPWTEDFEINTISNSGWTVENPDDDITWEITSTAGNTPGFRSASIDLRNYTSLGERDRLISPPFNFSNYSSVFMDFKHAYAQRFASSQDSLIVYVSNDCGESWSKIFEIAEDGTGSFATSPLNTNTFIPQDEDDWCNSGFGSNCFSLDLTPWAGSHDVKVMFESVVGFGNNMYIDNLEFSVISDTRENSMAQNEISIYPNPSNGLFSIRLNKSINAESIDILNIHGQMVFQSDISSNSESSIIELNLTSLPKGIYFIRLNSEQKTQAKKIIIK